MHFEYFSQPCLHVTQAHMQKNSTKYVVDGIRYCTGTSPLFGSVMRVKRRSLRCHLGLRLLPCSCHSSKEAWKARACTLMVMELIRTDMPSTTFSAKPYSLWTVTAHVSQCAPFQAGSLQAYLWPAVMAIGEGPLGGRGSSQVLISTSTLSRNCTKEKIELAVEKQKCGQIFIKDKEHKRPMLESLGYNETSNAEKYCKTEANSYQTDGACF